MNPLRAGLARLALAATLVAAPAVFAATDYTDSWWTPAEPGWGINLTHAGNAVFATFFVYGSDGKATWFTAQLARDGTADRFSGPLYRTSGTWFGAPAWNGYQIAQAGTAIFTASSPHEATLQYTVDGATVSKAVERLAAGPISVAGLYVGGVSGRRSGCATSGVIVDTLQFDVLHSTVTNAVRIDQLSTTTGRVVCRMEGTAVQRGKLLLVEAAAYTCQDGWNSPARIFNLRPTPSGFEGQWTSNAGNGCVESGQFSGVTQFP